MVKVIRLYDFKKCDLPDVLFQITVHQKDIDARIEKAAEHFLTIEDQSGEIKTGDIVAIKVESDDSFVNSECDRLSVGRGFYSEKVEQALLGKKSGETFTMDMDGTPAKITVLWVKRRVVPKLTDDMAANLGVEDVATVEEYKAYVIAELENEDKEKKQNAILLMVSKKLLEETEFEVDESEVEAQFKKDISYMRGELENDFEEFMRVKYHGETLEEQERNFKEEIEKTLKLCAIAAPMAEKDGIEWTEDDYNAVIDDMVNEMYTREELEASMSYEDYVKQQLQEYLKGKVLEYFDDRFTMTIVD